MLFCPPLPHLPLAFPLPLLDSSKRERGKHTNTINRNFNPRTHNLIPAINTPYQPSTSLEAAGAAERMREAGVGGEVFFYRGALRCGWRLGEEVDYVADF